MELANIADQHLSAGGMVQLTLYRRAEHKLDVNYAAFLHLVRTDGEMDGQHDDYPTGKSFPTSQWTPERLYRAECAGG